MNYTILRPTVFIIVCSCLFLFEMQAQFKIDAQYRPRFELRDGYKKLNSESADPAFIISQRTRVAFTYETEKLTFKFTPQDVRIWGDEQMKNSTGVFGDAASLDVYEAFAEVKLCKSIKISAGRQELVYDSQRIFANRNWNQNGLVYDAVVLKTSFKNLNLHLGSSWNSDADLLSENYYPSDRIKSISFIWLNKTFHENFTSSFMHTASGLTETDTTNQLFFKQTSGIYFNYKGKLIQSKGDLLYQFGKDNEQNKVNAFFAGIDVSVKPGKGSIGIGTDYLSGNKDTQSETDHLFDVLYGARHRYYGHMDYFNNFKSSTREAGLADYYLYLKYTPVQSITFSNTGHYFQTAQMNEFVTDSKNLGYENDFALNYVFSDWGSLLCEYMFFFPTDQMKAIQNAENTGFNQFFFIELTLRPTLFKQAVNNIKNNE